MRTVGLVYSDKFLAHGSETFHPENPQRLKAIVAALRDSGIYDHLKLIDPEPARETDILTNHSPSLYERARSTRGQIPGDFDRDTYYCAESFDTAMLAVGGVLKAGRLVLSGELDSAFCAVRPPGHHAEYDRIMGFCLFNNIAILARMLKSEFGLERIAILDWDGHHGNGTQKSFYDSDMVHFCSLHNFPFYPGSGRADEIGEGRGEGYTLNFPLPYGMGDREFIEAVQQWASAMDQYRPETILISAGFDAYTDDPYVGLNVTLDGFNTIMRIVKDTAEKHCRGKIISILEGGYVYDFLGRAVTEHIKILME